MKLSRRFEYAVHGLLQLASNTGKDHVLLTEIAEKQSIPESYLRKIFQALANAGIVKTQRGVNGGYTLLKKPEEITLRNIIEVIDGHPKLYSCIGDTRKCKHYKNCSLNTNLDFIEKKFYEFFNNLNLKEIIEGLQNGNGNKFE